MEFRMTFAVGALALVSMGLYLASLIWGLANCLERRLSGASVRRWQREREERQSAQLAELLAEVAE